MEWNGMKGMERKDGRKGNERNGKDTKQNERKGIERKPHRSRNSFWYVVECSTT